MGLGFQKARGRAHRGLGLVHFPCLAETPVVTPIVPTRSRQDAISLRRGPHRGAGVSSTGNHEWPGAAGAGATGTAAGGAEIGATGSHAAGEYSFA